MKPKKIIFTVTNDLVYDQRMQRICGALQKGGYFVELVGRIQKDSKPVFHFPFMQTRLRCFFNKGFLFYAEFNIRLFFFLVLNEFDIVCGCDLDTLPAAVLAGKIKGKKIVYDAHEYFPESPELIGRPFKQAVWRFFEKCFVPKSDKVYTVNDSIAAIFQKKYKIDSEVVFNYPYRSAALPAEKPEHYLLYQGAVNVGRGLNEMLLAMLQIENLPFYIAGDGDEMDHIKSSVQELKLGKKVVLLGKLTPDQLKQVTERAYIGINLLENRGLSYYYSLGNKTFDYIQAGIPQIMIGFPEYIALNEKYKIGIVVDELTVEKIQQAILKLTGNPELYAALQQNCLKARSELCWETQEEKLIAIYSSM